MRFTTIILAVVLVATIGLVTCTTGAHSETSAAPTPIPQTPVLPPVRYVFGCDKSMSINAARVTPDISADALDPLLGRIKSTGGEIGIGVISDNSNRPFVRVSITAQPVTPQAAPVIGNTFKAAEAKRIADAQRARMAGAVESWKRETDARSATFKRAITPLLQRPADAPATDIRTFIQRADLMLGEPSPFGRNVVTVIILVTDGKETVSTQPIPELTASSVIILVNGAGSVGALAPLKPVRFESIDAAIRYAAAIGGSHAR